MYDHSIASPLLLRGPGVNRGRSTAMSHHVDLFPTLCELAGIGGPPSACDGHSLLPLIRGETARVRDEILCEFYSPEQPGQPLRHSQRAIRTERWKLCWYPLIGRYTLYDMVNDPNELTDLLRPWRRRRRLALESGEAVWQGNPWAAWNPKPVYRDADIAAVADDLHQRLVDQMRRVSDPLLDQGLPPSPDQDQEETP